MTTFSQMIDAVVQEVKQKHLINDAGRYLNQAVREVHQNPEDNNAYLFRDNFTEIQLVAQGDSYVWDIPSPERFQGIAVVQYTSIFVDNARPYVPEMKPSRALAGMSRYYYRGGSRVAFKGYGGNGSTINLGFFQFPRLLKYKLPADRKVFWDEELGFTFDPSLVTQEQQAAALELETNWLIRRWPMVLEEALRAKIYKRVSDDARARTSYSLYAQLRKGLITAESYTEGWV